MPEIKSYEEWLALGPELAAKYLSDKNNHSPEKRRKIALILKESWNDVDQNRTRKVSKRYKKSLEK